MKKAAFLCALAIICLSGCAATPITPEIPQPQFVTATLPPSAMPAPTQPPPLPTAAPTIDPIAGMTTSEVNVRADTSTASQSLGTIPAFSQVRIIGKDASGNWLRIIFNDGAGWVRADLIQVEVTAEIPILEAQTGAGSAARGVVLRGVNVRSEPRKESQSLGLLNQNDVVSILARNPSGAWMKIEYPASPDGTGWVAAEYLQVENADAIPALETATQAVESAPSTEAPANPVRIAQADSDTADAPIASFTLAAGSVGAIQFQGEVSSPQGDGEDWIGFASQFGKVVIEVSCESGSVQVELHKSGEAPKPLALDCDGMQAVDVSPNQAYVLRVSPNEAGLIRYVLKIKIVA